MLRSSAIVGLLGFALIAPGCARPATDGASGSPAALDMRSAPRTAYRFELRGRSSEDPADAAGTFQLPAGSAIKDATPSIDAAGVVALGFRAGDDLMHAWKDGHVVYDVADSKAIISGTSIDTAGNVAFDVTGGAAANGIYRYDTANGTTAFLTAEPLGADGWLDVALLDDGRIGARPTAGARHFVGFPGADGFAKVAVDAATNPNSLYAYLFSAAFDGHGDVALKVMLVSGGNDVRLLRAGGAPPLVVAEDAAKNPSSAIEKIDNGVAVNDAGQIAYIAKVGGRRAVFRSDGTTTTRIAAEGEGPVGAIAFFAPVIDATGHVAFKGDDAAGSNTIWVGDGSSVDVVAASGDMLPSDQGDCRALPETDFDPQNRIVFGGGIAMNAAGDIAFSAALARTEGAVTTRLGTGLYVATRAR